MTAHLPLAIPPVILAGTVLEPVIVANPLPDCDKSVGHGMPQNSAKFAKYTTDYKTYNNFVR